MDSLCVESAREMEERFAVTAATGALGPVLRKLAALLGDEYKLQEGTRQGIESIKSDLDPVHRLLGKLWGREDLDVACKNWMAEARELSYDMEDGIDRFTLGFERADDKRETTDDGPFKEFMERVKDVSKRCLETQKIGDTICNGSKLTTDPRALFLHKDASELVGMEEKKQELIELLQENEMVCIVGPGGMGKTTLADLVYQAVGDEFQCRAFVSVHPSPNMTEILGTILSQVSDGAMSAGSDTDISISLSEKRYMVIIDDIWHWEEWEAIRKALPKNNLGCKLIMTTRIKSIAEKCETEQGAVVYETNFGRAEAERLSAIRLNNSMEGTNLKGLSNKIAGICGAPPFYFCPLAVICLSSAWAESHHVQQGCDDWELDTWTSHVLYEGFLSTRSLKPLVQSLCLGFDDLPLQIKTCLIYCSIYPSWYYGIDRGCLVRKWIDRDWFVRKWVAEGFVSQVEVADSYFDNLLSRNLLVWDMGMYTFHPIMRALLVCKAKEDNFIAYDGDAKLQIRRLSLSSTDRYPDEDVLSHVRSLFVSGYQWQLDGVPFKAFKMLRVLEIHNSSRPENGDLVDICGLIWLKYLDLMGCGHITELPQEIGRLQNLETLNVAGTRISKLPTEIGKLQHLEALDVSNTQVMELPREIKNLERLETLDVSHTNVAELPTLIIKLQSLKTLHVSSTEVTELPMWIEKLQSLKTLDISGTKVMELPREIGNLERLETLDISNTRVRELHKEIGKLQHLRTLDIRGTKVRELAIREDPNSSLSVVFEDRISGQKVMLPLGVISSSGGEEVISSSGANCRDDLSIHVLFNHFSPEFEVLPVRMLRVAGRYMKVPQWVKQDLRNVCSLDIRLCKLVEEDLEFLKTQMPNLRAVALRFEVLPREPVAITGGGFSKLETFYIDCRLPRVITFEEAAMPKLKHLEFKFYTGTASQDYSMGIKHLPKLENLVFRCSEYYTSDGPVINAMIEAMRKEATEHPNSITLYVNDKKPEVFRSGAKWISQADRAIMQKESEERERIKKQREQLYDAAMWRAEPSLLEEMEE